MPSLEERVSYLEGRGEEYGRGLRDVREAIFSLEQKVTHLDEKMDRRFDALDKKIDTRIWSVVGMQVVLLLAVIGALLR